VIIVGHISTFASTPIPNHTIYINGDSINGVNYNNVLQTDAYGNYCDTIDIAPLTQATFTINTYDCTNSLHTFTGIASSVPLEASFQICDSISPYICNAYFFANSDSLVNPAKFFFWDNSNPGITNTANWLWDFGDGTTSNLEFPSHIFTLGVHNICLTITTFNGCSSTYCDSINVTSNYVCSSVFNYIFDGNDSTIIFHGTTTSPYSTYYTWDMGDGTIIGPDSITFFSHTFYQHGYYNVCLTTIDSLGCSHNYCEYIYIGGSPFSCSANFFIFPDSVILHQYYAVNMASGATPLTYLWNWGDGTNSNLPFPNHTYTNGGFYTICLTITDSLGCTNTFCDSTYIQKTTNTIVNLNVIPNGSIGIIEQNKISVFSAFPNPASDGINIQLNQLVGNNYSLQLVNLLGEIVYSKNKLSQQTQYIETNNLSDGLYFIQLKTDKSISSKKIIIKKNKN
jgi:PKD repeat protein